MTLSSTHRILNFSPGGLRSSRLLLDHGEPPQYWIFTNERGRNFSFFETFMSERGTNPRSPSFQAGSFNHCTSPPPHVGLLVSWWASWALEIIPQTTWGGGGLCPQRYCNSSNYMSRKFRLQLVEFGRRWSNIKPALLRHVVLMPRKNGILLSTW